MRVVVSFVTAAGLLAGAGVGSSAAQAHDVGDHARHAQPGAASIPTQPGQAAFGAISEVVRVLDADPDTDWTRVRLEDLRTHLIDMDAVTMDAAVSQTSVPGGARMEIMGEGRIREAIVRMTTAHAAELNRSADMVARIEQLPGGVAMTVTAREAGDRRTEAKIRGFGFIGLLALGDHHAPHHLAIATGRASEAHRHD